MPPSVAVPSVEETACDGLSEGEMVLLSKFEHAAHGFLSFRLGRERHKSGAGTARPGDSDDAVSRVPITGILVTRPWKCN